MWLFKCDTVGLSLLGSFWTLRFYIPSQEIRNEKANVEHEHATCVIAQRKGVTLRIPQWASGKTRRKGMRLVLMQLNPRFLIISFKMPISVTVSFSLPLRTSLWGTLSAVNIIHRYARSHINNTTRNYLFIEI